MARCRWPGPVGWPAVGVAVAALVGSPCEAGELPPVPLPRDAAAALQELTERPFEAAVRREPKAGSGGTRRPGPNVPEPMVFDLVRPLGVRRGELEANVLGFVPLRRGRFRDPFFSFITGADRQTGRRPAFEWAPEAEYGLFDNFAVEFELPMAGGRVEAFKGAAQYTLGTAFDDRFIHGLQGILFVDRSNGAVTPTLLYLAALRFDPTYSGLLMLGFNHEFGGDNPAATQVLFNATLFAELTPRLTLALEANYASELDGSAGLLFMPQAHVRVTDRFTVQAGVGTRQQEGALTGEAVFRLIWAQ